MLAVRVREQDPNEYHERPQRVTHSHTALCTTVYIRSVGRMCTVYATHSTRYAVNTYTHTHTVKRT